MTNKEKREYFSLALAYSTSPYPEELSKWNEFLSKRPKNFYKYRKFDQYTYDMLDNGYAYLTPAGQLDDPFDCLTNIDLESAIKEDLSLTDEMINFINDVVLSHPHSGSLRKTEIKKIIKKSLRDGKLDSNIFEKEIEKAGYLDKKDKELYRFILANMDNFIATATSGDELNNLFSVLNNSKTSIGICSLTTKRDNKVMWSLYSDTYKGYCIEYEHIKNTSILKCLRPVIYTDKNDNDILKKIVQFSLESSIRFFSNGSIETYIGTFDELLCMKDSGWEYQDEWRIVSTPGLKIPMKAKAVYLGFNVSKEDELHMEECAKRNGFDLYKMNIPKGQKITYSKMELP